MSRRSRNRQNPSPSSPPAIDRTNQPAASNRVATVTQSLSFTGPLPPPAMLERYNQVFPGCAERIVLMAESQATHRQHLESTHLQGALEAQKRGQIFALIIGMAAVIGGVVLVAFDKDAAGLSAII